MEIEVLIVEDDLIIAELLQERLELRGIKSRHAEDTAALNDIMSSDLEPKHIILDLMLEEQNGLDFLINLRNRWQNSKIYIFTAYPEYKDKVPVMEHYIDGFYSKTDMGTLVDLISAAQHSDS